MVSLLTPPPPTTPSHQQGTEDPTLVIAGALNPKLYVGKLQRSAMFWFEEKKRAQPPHREHLGLSMHLIGPRTQGAVVWGVCVCSTLNLKLLASWSCWFLAT